MLSFVRQIEQRFIARPGRFSTLLAWGNQGISILANLAIVPLIIHEVGTNVAGIWFFLLNWSNLLGIFDFGFSQCISRQITFSVGKKAFFADRTKGHFIRRAGPRMLGNVIAASRMLFRAVSVVMLVFGIVAERSFLFAGHMQADLDAHVAWYLMIAAAIVANEARVYGAALNGLLFIPQMRIVALLQNVVQNTLLAVILLFWPRLETMSMAILAGGLLAWACQYLLWRFRRPPEIIVGRPKLSMVARIWRLSWEQGVASASAYFTFTVNPLLIGYLLGPEKSAVFYLPLRISALIFGAIAEIISPQTNLMISQYRDHQIHGLLVRFFRVFIVITSVSFIAYAVFALAGPWAVHIWSLGKIDPPVAVFWVMALYYFLAMIQTLLAVFITAHGTQPFARIAVVCATLNVALLFGLTPILGLTGAALATFLAQLLTSNWFMPWYAARLFKDHFREVPARVAWRDAVASLWTDFEHLTRFLLRK